MIILLEYSEYDYMLIFTNVIYIYKCSCISIGMFSFQLEEFQLALYKAGLWWWIPSGFICLRESLSQLYFWRTAFPVNIFLVENCCSCYWLFFLSTLNISSHCIPSNMVFAEKCTLALWSYPCKSFFLPYCLRSLFDFDLL